MPTIQGTVTREGTPVGGAYVRCHGPSGEFVAEIYTRNDGAFTFHVADGTWRITAKAAEAGETEISLVIQGEDVTADLDLS